MPAVDVAMERSLRRGFLDFLVASVRPALERRDIQGQISDVKTAFSSWDNCMQVAYCKWPVIALIIIGGLIIISVVWCIVRCACCGMACCCSCFQCLKCCGDCCGCCDPPRGSRRKYLDEPYIPPNHGYKSQEPMHAGYASATIPTVAKAPDYPQYAEFDMGGKKNEDALPQMPSWEGAGRKKVLVEEEAVEMNALKKPEAGALAGGAAGVGGTAAAVTSPGGSRSPVNRSPYGPPGPGTGSNGYFGVAHNDPYAQGAPAYNQPGMAHGGDEHGYAMGAGAMGRRSPHAYHDGGYDNGYHDDVGYGQAHDHPAAAGQGGYDNYGAGHQQPYDSYDHYGSSQANQGYGIARHQTPHETDASPYGPDARRSPAPQAGPYGAPYNTEARRSPAPQGPYGTEARRSPAPQAGYGAPYGGPEARRSPAPRGGDYARRSPGPQQGGGYRAPPRRQYSANNNSSSNINDPGNTTGPSPLRNDAGFDFTSGYSRPPATNAGGYRQPSPALEDQGRQVAGGGGSAYPGYKPYQPAA